jgi:large repetitive protein
MGKFYISLKISGFFLLLTTSALASYWYYPAIETYSYPQKPITFSTPWYESPMGIFAVSYNDCTNDTEKPTITAPANVSVTTDANSCTASGVALGTPTTADNCGVKSVTNDAPSNFPIGSTTVTWTVTDNSDNIQTATQTVTVTDVQKPTITAPANVSTTTDANSCTASGVTLGTPTTADNCGVKSVTNDAPSNFPIGSTMVTWTVTDNSDNIQTATQTVTVTDVQKPTITAPANVSVTTDANSCTASGVTLGTPTTADNCGVKSVTNDAPSNFPIGSTTVTWTVTDNSDNIQTATQTVTVTDVQKPTITAPANVSTTTDANSCTASGVTLGTPTTADNCGVKSVTNDAPSNFPIGSTMVTWTVTDNSDNIQTATQTVTVTDAQKPTITAPANVSVTTNANSCTASGVTLGTPTTADNCGVKSVTNDAPSNFPIGTTTVTWTVIDNSDNIQTATQTVTVTDVQKPTITAPANVSVTTDANSCTASGVALGTPATDDNCGVKSVTNDAPSVFPLGTTTVTWTVTDDSDNTQTATQTVTVTDTQKPTITAPANVSVTTDANNCTATGVALGTPITADNCGVKKVESDAPSVFPLGTTTVTWTVTDDSNNTQTATQTVTVTDTQKPTITAPANVSVTTDANNCTATGVALGTPITADNCGVKKVESDAPSVFLLGTTTVTWTVTDDSNNTQTATQTVTVTDTQKPTITAPANVSVTTDANNCTASGVALGTPITADNCGVKKVESDAPSVFPLGTTTVTWTVTDDSDNTQTATQTVTVTDTQKPTITAPANVSVTTDANNCTATGVALGTPITADNCGVKKVESDAPSVFPLGTTTVTWTVTDDSDNTQTATQTVTVTDVQKPLITPGADITVPNTAGQCYAGVSGVQATATDNCSVGNPVGVRSDGEALNATYPVGETTVTWTVTDANGNAADPVVQTIIVEDKEAPEAPQLEDILWGCTYTVEAPTTIDNCDNSITATTTQSTTFTTSGEITWTFTDTAGNITEVVQSITIDPVQIAPVDIVHVLCNGNATGAITVEASGGVGPYTYDWGSLGAGDTKTDLPAGNYSVRAFDVNGCETETINITITEPEAFVEIVNPKTTSGCYGQNNGTAYAEAIGGTPGYSFLWSNGQTTQTATGLSPGNHTVTVTDANGCSAERTVTVSQPTELKINGFLTTETTSYGSATGTATVQITGGTPNYTYKWNDPNNQTGQTATNLLAGTYSVTVTDANGCTTTDIVEVVDALFANIIPVSICEDDNTIRTSYFEVEGKSAIGGTAPYTYSWNFGEKANPATATGPGTHKVTYDNIGDKLITLTVKDAKGREYQQSIIQYVGGCFSDDCGSNDLGLESYFIGGTDIDNNGNPEKITSENCSTIGQKYIYINFPTEPQRYSLQIELIYSVENIETNTITNYRVKDCFYNKEYIPDVAQTFAIDYNCGDLVKVEGIYLTFQVNKQRSCGTTQGNGNNPKCYSTNNEATVTSPLFGVAFPNALLCYGGKNGIINSRASGGTGNYTYKLISADNGTTIRNNQESSTFNELPAGRYKVVISDGETSYTTKEIEILQPQDPLEINLISTTDVTCYSGTDGSATVIASGGTKASTEEGYIYVWDNGQTTPTATNLEAGEHEVIVRDANGCEVSLVVTIHQPAELLANAGPDQVLECGNFTTNLAAVFEPEVPEGEAAPQGIWTIVNGPSGGEIADINDPFSSFSGNTGTYTLRWTVPCGTTDDVKISFTNCSTLDFDGVNDHVVIGDKFNLPSTFTIEAWVKQDAGKTSGKKTVISKRDNSSLNSGGFDLIIENDFPKFRWNGNVITSNYKIGTDRWYHLAVIMGGDDRGLYVDGIKVSANAPGAPSSIAQPVIIGASYNATSSSTENFFHGWIEEVRLWNKSLSLDQVRFLMNQRLKIGSNPLEGTALPLAAPGPLNFNEDLIAYYPLIVSEITAGSTKDRSKNAHDGKMVNIKTLQKNTAPLPYYSARNGAWTADNTWLHPTVWDYPNSQGIDGSTFIDWNIVVTAHNITSQAKNIRVLGLLNEAGKLTVSNPNNTQNETNSGQSLSISHYLRLNGIIDLFGRSQLLQDEGSLIDPNSEGHLEIDQQGTASSYNYNYWTSPVSPGINASYNVKGSMKDGTITTFKELTFGNQYHFADGPFTNPRRISNYWLHKFHGTANNYFSWDHIGSNKNLAVGEGYSMKGTSGHASNSDLQNYTFVGLPNNGDITLEINKTTQGENYLIGNPYPSSLDAAQFILDNVEPQNHATSSFNGSLYFWDHFAKTTHYLAHYVGGYAVFNLSGSIEPASSVDSRIDNSDPSRTGSKRPGDYIPPGQAFFINTIISGSDENVETTGGQSIVFKNSQRIYKREGIDKDGNNRDQVVFFGTEKKDRKETKSKEIRKRIWIKFKSPKGYHRQLLITADERASDGFDLGFDAPLIDNNIEDMYWMMTEQVKLVIQGVPDFNPDRVLPLGIKTAEGGDFTIAIDELENIDDEFKIFIKDKETGEYHNLRETFFTGFAVKGKVHDRYELVFTNDDEPNEENPGEGEEDGGEDGGEDGDKDGGDGDGDGNGDGDGDLIETEQPQPTPPADIELLYSNKQDQVIIKNSGLLPLQKAVLYNALGQEIFTYGNLPVQEYIELPVEVAGKGVYFIRVHLKDSTKSLKFIVE